jgi:hypothetical protein
MGEKWILGGWSFGVTWELELTVAGLAAAE